MKSQVFYLQNLTALHVGTGQGIGVVDLPIARAKATNLPIVPGSAIKGVLRDELVAQSLLEAKDVKTLFGPDTALEDAHAGAIAFGDANLLLLPIRSFAGTVAYATCPFILRQYQRDNQLVQGLDIPHLDESSDDKISARVASDSCLKVGKTEMIALEDLDIKVYDNEATQKWANAIATSLYADDTQNYKEWREQIVKRFVILPDNIFSFLADTATEIRTRIRIVRETRVVKDGALWTEENLPADSVFWGVLGVSDSRNKSDKKKAEELAKLLPQEEMQIQIGGKHTVGRGFCRLLIAKTEGE